ncbi:hypothetical protein LOAG_17364 [Loa loa]|uniref:Uncharacterized protein n=1 Tax=Loa loa TaxID=7209 RepID=A0A1S0UL21_LOALO|nr:hypothetical protein LOAG_17364 [Loa loa]EJD75494.1 hypothetical protein LOAG_17364 [Loa loa]
MVDRFFIALFLCHSVLCFQEHYYYPVEKPTELEERMSPFFQWFRLPRIRAPSLKEEYTVYEEDIPQPIVPASTAARHRRSQDRTYEVTTTTESFHRTISPPQQQQQNGYGGY